MNAETKHTDLSHREAIVPRSDLDFELHADIPRYWMGGNPFKTRVFDGVQMSFPDGERYFITSVRAYKNQITDPALQQEVKDFTWQEGQHGQVHTDFNERLKQQGIPVDRMLGVIRKIMDGRTKKRSAQYNVAMTAALEHFTAMMAETFFAKKEVMADADPRVRAMLAWHAVEEMEHKAVAFDVMKKVAKVGYFKRTLAMSHAIFAFSLHMVLFTWVLLKHDGFSVLQRLKMFASGLVWLYGPKGLFSSLVPSLLTYYKPGFHPCQTETVHNYQAWLKAFEQTGSGMLAGQAMYEAAY